jgi:tetratricopeptide (TPR) repeat protein
MNRNLILLAAAAALAIASTGCDKLKARDNLNRGVQAYKNAKYPEAIDYFQKAVQLDPSFKTTHLYLATAYMTQYIPGADSPENVRLAESAYNEFQTVLKLDPKDTLATASIASLYFNQKKLDDAAEWNKKLIAIDPENKAAYYTLGVIAWTQWLVPDREARNKMNMKPEDPGPLKDKKVRDELKAKYKPLLDEGVTDMQKALDIDKEYDEAMAYMNLLIRYRADLDDTPEEYKKDVESADDWVQKALATKKIKAERQPKSAGGITNDVMK